jgi:hypothetical protein
LTSHSKEKTVREKRWRRIARHEVLAKRRRHEGNLATHRNRGNISDSKISAENIKPTTGTSGSASDTTTLNLDKDGRSVNLVIFDYRTAPKVTLRALDPG